MSFHYLDLKAALLCGESRGAKRIILTSVILFCQSDSRGRWFIPLCVSVRVCVRVCVRARVCIHAYVLDLFFTLRGFKGSALLLK